MVDKRFELMSLIFRLAGAEEYNHTGTEHQQTIAQTFNKFSNHSAVNYAKDLRQNYGISYNAVFSFALHIQQNADKFILAGNIDWLDKRWTRESAETFIPLLNDFYKETEYENFYQSNISFYQNETERFMREVISELNFEWFIKYGINPANLRCVITPSFSSLNYSNSMDNGVVYALMSAFSKETLIHEYIHGFTNPIGNDWYENNPEYKRYCDETAADPRLRYIGNMPWEYVTHAYTVLYFAQHGVNPVPLLLSDYSQGFKYIQEVYAMITNHEKVDFLTWIGIDWKNAERIGQEHTFTFPNGSITKWQYINIPGFSIEGLKSSGIGNVFNSQTGDIFIRTIQNIISVSIDLGPAPHSGFRSYLSIPL
jgi:hypothetical protein